MNRQVRSEAEHIFHNYNLFVLVTINVRLSLTFDSLIRPFALAFGEVAQSFNQHAIALDLNTAESYSLELPNFLLLPEQKQHQTSSCFMIVGEDIPWLVRALGIIDGIYESLACPLLQHTCLSISALGPLKGATTPENGRSQDDLRLGKLLEPFCHHHGIQEVYLDAAVSADYKQRIIEGILKPWLCIEDSVERATTFMRTGDEAFRRGRHLQAIYAYQEALDCLPFVYGFIGPWRNDGYLAEELPTEIFFDIFNRQRAARIRLEIGRKALEPAVFAQSGTNRLVKAVKAARAGIDYAIDRFSNWNWSEEGVYVYEWGRDRVGLDVQLDIIIDFESEPHMKKALWAFRSSVKNSFFRLAGRYQYPWGYWDGWILEM